MKYVSKKFLTPHPTENGSVVATFGSDDVLTAYDLRHPSIEGKVRIADCYKVIELSFDTADEEEYIGHLDKFDVLISELELAKQGFKDVWEDYQKRLEELRLKAKQVTEQVTEQEAGDD